MEDGILDNSRRAPPSGGGAPIAGGGSGRTVRELYLYTVIGDVFIITRSLIRNSWSRGVGEAVGTYGLVKFSIKDPGQRKIGECTTVEGWMCQEVCAGTLLLHGHWQSLHHYTVNDEESWIRGETVGICVKYMWPQDLQVGLAGN